MLRPLVQLPNSQTPVNGSCGVRVPLDFTATDNVAGDLMLEMANGNLGFIQSIYIDNRANAKLLSITFPSTGYNISIKAGMQGIFPVIVAPGPLFYTAQSVAAGVIVPTIMMNERQPYFTWATI